MSRKWGLLTLLFLFVLAACAFWIARAGPSKNPVVVRWQFVVVMLVLIGLCVLAGLIVHGRVDGILIDDRNRISLARFQWVVWFILIIGGYYTEAVWNAANGADLPQIQTQLLVLLGISSGSAVVSNLIVDNKKTTPPPPAAPPASAARPPTAAPPAQVGALAANTTPDNASWSELYLGEEAGNFAVVDISRLQSLVITVLLAMIFVVFLWDKLGEAATAKGLALPTFDDKNNNNGFLWLLGISHSAYLAQKATPKPA